MTCVKITWFLFYTTFLIAIPKCILDLLVVDMSHGDFGAVAKLRPICGSAWVIS